MNTAHEFEVIRVDKPALAFACRTCLSTDSSQQLTPIFEDTKTSGKFDVFDQLLQLNLKIKKDDRCPANICNVCLERLKSVDAFRKQCEKAQEYLEQNFDEIPEYKVECKLEVESTKLEPPDYDDDDDGNEGDHLSDRADTDESLSKKEEFSSEENDALEGSSSENHEEKLKCPVCEKIFRTVAIRNDHLYLHSDVRGFSCNQCDKSFKTRGYLRKHKAAVHTFGEHECATCGMKFSKTFAYRNHLKSHNRTGKPRTTYNCSYCNKSFDHRNHWHSHELTHTRNRSHLCNICGKSFIYDSSLKSHLKKHLQIHNEVVKKYACDICSKTFSRKDSLKAHHDAHLNVKGHQCDKCGMKFNNQNSLKGHEKLHNAEKKHLCEFCPESYLRIRDLRRHRLLVHNKAEEINPGADQLLQEKEVITIKAEENPPKEPRKRPTEDKPYSCDLCGKSFRIPSALGNHMRMHSEDRPYVCKECGNGFNNIVHLKHHIEAVHMKQKPYSCEVCKKSFARLSDRNRHTKMHTGDKTHQCTDCGKVFTWAMSLKIHIREHTGEKPFVCLICNMGFARQNYLARHTKNAHSGVLTNPPMTVN